MPIDNYERSGNARALLYQQGQSAFAFVAINPSYSRPELEALHQRAQSEPHNVRAQGLVNPFYDGPQIILIETAGSDTPSEDFVNLVLRLLPDRNLTSRWRTDHDDISVMLAHLLRQRL